MVARVALVLAVTFGVAVSAQQAVPQGPPYRPGPGIQNPTVTRSVQPKYTREALQARVNGVVELEAVVKEDGTVGDIRIIKSLDAQLGLDAEAITAAKQWSFRPGRLVSTGQIVPVTVTIILEFRVHPDAPNAALAPVNVVAGDDFYEGVYPLQQPQLVQPTVIRMVIPKYTADAMRAKIQGTVEVEAVIGTDGRVMRARVVRSLDQQFGLDENAVEATKAAVFEPGRLNGQPVPVVVRLTQEFRLH